MAPPPLFIAGKELPILWEDKHFLVINKPAGLAAHPGPRTQDSVETRLTPQKRGGPWLVHRLDTDTAGCLLIARRKTALIAAQKAFTNRLSIKRYWAVVIGQPSQPEGTLKTMVCRESTPQGGWKMRSVHSGSKHHTIDTSKMQNAKTSWRTLATNGQYSLLELTLHTGRTHQARLHCAELGSPILGDILYGERAQHNTSAGQALTPTSGLCLLARSLHVPVSLPTEARTHSLHKTAPPIHIQATAENERINRLIQQYFGTAFKL